MLHATPMRVQLLSDVHVEFHADQGADFVRSLEPAGVDVLVLAGDIAVGPGIVGALGLFCERYRDATVLYVHGNHEFYGTDRESVVGFTRAAVAAHENLVWLDSETAEIGGQRFVGGPLWFERRLEAARFKRSMADFGQITRFESWVYDENRRMKQLLAAELREADVVVTHHLPTQRSVSPRFLSSPLNAFFVCDVEELIEERRPRLWMHGHTHVSVDTRIGPTRILCNPFGYAGWELNPGFVDGMYVDL
jgi:Icc-related predicted phosphoesterase